MINVPFEVVTEALKEEREKAQDAIERAINVAQILGSELEREYTIDECPFRLQTERECPGYDKDGYRHCGDCITSYITEEK
jgi:hypothetical protein